MRMCVGRRAHQTLVRALARRVSVCVCVRMPRLLAHCPHARNEPSCCCSSVLPPPHTHTRARAVCYHALSHTRTVETCPRVVICASDPATIRLSEATLPSLGSLRLQIHFSEPVEDFIRDDVVVSPPGTIAAFAMLRSDLYVVDVAVERSSATAGAHDAHADAEDVVVVEVPAGVARSRAQRVAASGYRGERDSSGGGNRASRQQLNAHSNRFLLRLDRSIAGSSSSRSAQPAA